MFASFLEWERAYLIDAIGRDHNNFSSYDDALTAELTAIHCDVRLRRVLSHEGIVLQ